MNYNIHYEHKDNDDGVMEAACAWHALALDVSLRCQTPHMIALVGKGDPVPDFMERAIDERIERLKSPRGVTPLALYLIVSMSDGYAVCKAYDENIDGTGEFQLFAEATEPQPAETSF